MILKIILKNTEIYQNVCNYKLPTARDVISKNRDVATKPIKHKQKSKVGPFFKHAKQLSSWDSEPDRK